MSTVATLTEKKIANKTAKKPTLQEWLASEVAEGHIIAPKNTKPIPKLEKPEPGLDWHSVYELSRSDL